MDPAFVPVRMDDIYPFLFFIYHLKRHSFINGETDILTRSGPRADVALVFFDNDRFDVGKQRLVNPTAITFEIFKQIPAILFFQHVQWMVALNLPDDWRVGIRFGTNVGDSGFNTQPFRLCRKSWAR